MESMTHPLHEFKPTTAAEAQAMGLKRFFPGRACVNGHVAEWQIAGGRGRCSVCAKEAQERYLVSNPEAQRQNYLRYRQKNPERFAELNRASAARFRSRRPDRWREINQDSYWRNAEKNRERAREYRRKFADDVRQRDRDRYASDPSKKKASVKKWVRNNADRKAAIDGSRRAARLRATPPWLTAEHKAQITAFYAEARRLTRETGVPHHVDHIHPLQGENVCGLHVPWNLQVMLGADNIRKRNKLVPDRLHEFKTGGK